MHSTLVLLSVLVADPRVGELAQHEFTSPAPLLAEDGELLSWGWARRGVLTYNRAAIPKERLGRVKEWEHYTIMSPRFTVGVTIAQLGSLTFGSAEVIYYEKKSLESGMFLVPQKSLDSVFPSHPRGETRFARKENLVTFAMQPKERVLEWNIVGTGAAPTFVGKVALAEDPAEDSIAITRPFDQPGEFFYENKIFGMAAEGTVRVGEREYTFPKGESFAIFDWGRGIWPRSSSWFWGQGATVIDGRRVAINLGHGYGDDRHGTANAILVEGKLTKLGDVAVQFDAEDRMKPWRFSNTEGTLRLTFTPSYHQESKQNIGVAAAELHKIHGHYAGELQVQGKTIIVENMLGFAEHMRQRW